MFLHLLFLMPCHRNGSFSFAGHASFSLLSRQPRYCLKNLSCLYQPACAMEKQKWYLKTNDTTKKGGFVEETHEAKATLTRDEVLGTCRGWREQDIKHSGRLFGFNDVMWDVERHAVGIVCFYMWVRIIGTWADMYRWITGLGIFWGWFCIIKRFGRLYLDVWNVTQVILTDDNLVCDGIWFFRLLESVVLMQSASLGASQWSSLLWTSTNESQKQQTLNNTSQRCLQARMHCVCLCWFMHLFLFTHLCNASVIFFFSTQSFLQLAHT